MASAASSPVVHSWWTHGTLSESDGVRGGCEDDDSPAQASPGRGHWRIPDPPENHYPQYEILDGQLFGSPTPLRVHQEVVGNLACTVKVFVDRRRLGTVILGPIGVMLAEYDAVQSDFVYVSNERQGILSPRAVEGIPDLIVEVAEPATSARDRGLKLKRYAAAHVPHYWIVDALEATIEERVLGEDGYGPPASYRVGDSFEPLLFPGLAIEVTRLWP